MPESAWQRRVRRILFFAGSATSVYLFVGYLLARMRDARIRALRDRREKEVIKAHFTSVLSTISFTLYALLSTLEPQLFAAYPVEATSQALRARSADPQPLSPTTTGTTLPSTPADSILIESPEARAVDTTANTNSHSNANGATDPNPDAASPPDSVSVSVSEFSAVTAPSAPFEESDSEVSTSEGSVDMSATNPTESWASEFGRASAATSTEDDLLTASSGSQAISLFPMDTSSIIPSSVSNFSYPQSPPRPVVPAAEQRSKKELWRDLKVQSLTRAIATAYLVPLVYLLTSSQLTILARLRYLSDVKAANARREQERQEGEPGIWAYISSANKLLPTSVTQWFFGADNTPTQQASEDADEEERLFLSYSWWLLHEGWRTIAARVEGAVDTVFGPLGLKRELTPESWAMLLGELRLNIEFQDDAPYDFAPLVLPPTPLPPLLPAGCPLPPSPAGRPHLARLLSETREHIVSPDARVLVDRGVDSMLAALESALDLHARHRRVADCLPVLNAWSKNVWEGIPDAGVEALLARPEFEAFAALVFGDWAPR